MKHFKRNGEQIILEAHHIPVLIYKQATCQN